MTVTVNFSRATQAALDVFNTVVNECELSDCTTTAITGTTNTGDVVVFSGSFTVFIDPQTGECIPTGGTITEMSITCGGVLFLDATNIQGDFASFANFYQADDLDGWFAQQLAGGSTQNAGDGDDNMLGYLPILVGDDIINLGGGNDIVNGGGGSDTINGGSGNDMIDGGTGSDTMAGGADNDVYTVDDMADIVTELLDEGDDIVDISSVTTCR